MLGELHRWLRLIGHDGRSIPTATYRWRCPAWHNESASRSASGSRRCAPRAQGLWRWRGVWAVTVRRCSGSCAAAEEAAEALPPPAAPRPNAAKAQPSGLLQAHSRPARRRRGPQRGGPLGGRPDHRQEQRQRRGRPRRAGQPPRPGSPPPGRPRRPQRRRRGRRGAGPPGPYLHSWYKISPVVRAGRHATCPTPHIPPDAPPPAP